MNRITIICVFHPDTSVLLKDRVLGDKTIEVSVLQIRGECMLWCKHCYTNNCDHATFVYYSNEFGMLKSLFKKPGCVCCCGKAIRIKLEPKRNEIAGYLVGRYVAPMLAVLLIGMDMIPIYYNPLDQGWHSMLTQLLGLVPLAPIGSM